MHKWITTYNHHLINLLYILEPGKGFEFHTQELIDGYIDGFCDNSPPGRGSDLMKRHLIAPDPARIYIGFLYGTQEEI
jgi:hypothetical protein